jgi:hypothetical protein
MMTARPLSGVMAGSDERFIAIEPARTWRQPAEAFRRLRLVAIALPDRGEAAAPDDLPPEFYCFPGF